MPDQEQQKPEQAQTLSVEDSLALERQLCIQLANENVNLKRQRVYDVAVMEDLRQRLAKFEKMAKTAIESGPVAVPPPEAAAV